MNVTIVAGARPNFMKIAPIIKAIDNASASGNNIRYRLVHTGQHFDKKMSGDFFKELDIPEPDINLMAGGGTQAEQTAAVMVSFEKELLNNKPDVVLVVGDVTSTMACTITAKKLCIAVGHVEAGIRSGDTTMPEEINRMVTDAICDHFFTTTIEAAKNLELCGTAKDRIHFVGNTMIDTLYQNIEKLRQPKVWDSSQLSSKNFFLLTLHRPSNVDDNENLKELLTVILNNSYPLPVIFPVHPRTKKVLDSLAITEERLVVTDPLGYHEFIYLVKECKAVITDSGGITEEATVLGVPCMTLRDSTERPETITIGTNELVGAKPENLRKYFVKLKAGDWKTGEIPELWDGNTASRIIKIVLGIYNGVSI